MRHLRTMRALYAKSGQQGGVVHRNALVLTWHGDRRMGSRTVGARPSTKVGGEHLRRTAGIESRQKGKQLKRMGKWHLEMEKWLGESQLVLLVGDSCGARCCTSMTCC
jgi:hypothetical protein